jgi:hypothetical protein
MVARKQDRRESVVDRPVDDDLQRLFLRRLQVLADAIVDDDRIVDRVADERQQCRDDDEVELRPSRARRPT